MEEIIWRNNVKWLGWIIKDIKSLRFRNTKEKCYEIIRRRIIITKIIGNELIIK